MRIHQWCCLARATLFDFNIPMFIAFTAIKRQPDPNFAKKLRAKNGAVKTVSLPQEKSEGQAGGPRLKPVAALSHH